MVNRSRHWRRFWNPRFFRGPVAAIPPNVGCVVHCPLRRPDRLTYALCLLNRILYSGKRAMQISIRALLAVIALTAVCLGGFVSGPPFAWVGTVLLALLLLGFAINAAIGVGETRRFAVGLLIPASAYLSLTLFVSDNEYAASGGRLPTTRIAQALMQPRYSGKTMRIGQFSSALHGVRDTLPLVHLSCACVLGFAGAVYASWICRRQAADRG